MKKLIIICLLAVSVAAPAQQISKELPSVKTDYLKISRNQKTAAWLMLGGGIIVGTGGMLIAVNSIFYDPWSEDMRKNYSLGTTMMYLGGASMIGSIPLFIASARNKGRSM